MSARLAGAVHDRRVVLVDRDLLAGPQVLERDILQLDPQILRDHLAAGEDGDILQHRLAPIAEARRLDRGALERPADLVDDERGQGLAFDVLGDDQERPAHLGDLLEEGHHVLHGADLLFVEQDVGVFEVDFHLVGIGDEVGGDVPPVELHPLDDLQGGLHPLGLFDGDHPLLADLLHRLGDHLPDGLVVVRRDGADLGDLFLVSDLFGHLLQFTDDQGDPLVDPVLQGHGIHAGDDEFRSLTVDRLGEDRGGRGAVAGLVRGLGGHLFDHLRPHVLEPVLQFDLLGDGHAVLGDLG